MVDSKENYKFDPRVKGLRKHSTKQDSHASVEYLIWNGWDSYLFLTIWWHFTKQGHEVVKSQLLHNFSQFLLVPIGKNTW